MSLKVSIVGAWDGHGGETVKVAETSPGEWVWWKVERWPSEGVQWTHVYAACIYKDLPSIPRMLAWALMSRRR